MTNSDTLPKISAAQLFCILMLSRISAEIIFPRSGAGLGGETFLALIIAELIRFALALPAIIYSFSGNSFYRAIWRKHKVLGWISAAGACLLLIGAAAKTLLNTAVFAQRSLLPKAAPALFIIIAALFAVYAAYMGAEALARSGTLFLVAAAIITAAVIIADIPYMHRDSVMPSQQLQYDGLLGDIIEQVMRGGDYIVFAALLPYVDVKKNKGSDYSVSDSSGKPGRRSRAGRAVLFFALFSTLAEILLCGFYCLTLREFYGLTEYPFTAAASLSDIALLKRLDGIGAAVWTLCAAFRAGLMLFCGWSAINELIRAIKAAKGTNDNVPKAEGGAV